MQKRIEKARRDPPLEDSPWLGLGDVGTRR